MSKIVGNEDSLKRAVTLLEAIKGTACVVADLLEDYEEFMYTKGIHSDDLDVAKENIDALIGNADMADKLVHCI